MQHMIAGVQHRPQTSFRITKLVLTETGTFNSMYSRPYETHITGEDLSNITTRIEQNNHGPITGTLMSGVASNIVRPSVYAHSPIYIPNGWSERRIRFYMECQVQTPTGSEFLYCFQGYTSHLGVGMDGSIDPQMEFIINSFIRISRSNMYTAQGMQSVDTITESAHVINGQIHSQMQGAQGVYSMRPVDVFTGIESNALSSTYKQYYQTDSFNDTRVNKTGEHMLSSRGNNLPSNYMAKIVDGYQTARKLADFGQGERDIMANARHNVYEHNPQENSFFRAISNIRGIPNTTSFTFNELQKLDPNVPNVTNYVALGVTAKANLHHAGQTADWADATRSTWAATVLSNAVPALMMDLMFSKIRFSATNHSSNGTPVITIEDYGSLTNTNLTGNFELFKKRIANEIMYDITYQNSELYMLRMSSDLFGETRISISVGSEPMTDFVTPSFCDSLMVPVVTGNMNSYVGVVNDFDKLMNAISNDVSNTTVVNHLI